MRTLSVLKGIFFTRESASSRLFVQVSLNSKFQATNEHEERKPALVDQIISSVLRNNMPRKWLDMLLVNIPLQMANLVLY